MRGAGVMAAVAALLTIVPAPARAQAPEGAEDAAAGDGDDAPGDGDADADTAPADGDTATADADAAGAATLDADDDRPRPPRRARYSLGAGGSLLVTGVGDGTRNRGEAHLELLPGGRWKRYGLLLALRHATFDPPLDDALITAGVVFEAAASRPRLSLALHADVGFQLAARAPAAGGGLQTHLWLAPRYVPIALVFDLTGHLVVDGVDDTALVLSASTALAIAW